MAVDWFNEDIVRRRRRLTGQRRSDRERTCDFGEAYNYLESCTSSTDCRVESKSNNLWVGLENCGKKPMKCPTSPKT